MLIRGSGYASSALAFTREINSLSDEIKHPMRMPAKLYDFDRVRRTIMFGAESRSSQIEPWAENSA